MLGACDRWWVWRTIQLNTTICNGWLWCSKYHAHLYVCAGVASSTLGAQVTKAWKSHQISDIISLCSSSPDCRLRWNSTNKNFEAQLHVFQRLDPGILFDHTSSCCNLVKVDTLIIKVNDATISFIISSCILMPIIYSWEDTWVDMQSSFFCRFLQT